MNQQQQNHRQPKPLGGGGGYWRQIFALDSVVKNKKNIARMEAS